MTSTGRDSRGITRNIARDLIRAPDVYSKGHVSILDWPDVCKSLCPKPNEDGISVR